MATYNWIRGDSTSNSLSVAGSMDFWTMWGLDGNDSLYGGTLSDTLFGGDGLDFLVGNEGNDYLYGGNGNDVLRGGAGGDRLEGGLGFDLADYSLATAGVRVALDNSLATTGEATGDALVSIEGAVDTQYDDLIMGNAEDNVIFSSRGNDRLVGGAGIDTYALRAQPGADLMGNPLPTVAGYVIVLGGAQAQTQMTAYKVTAALPSQYGVAFAYNGAQYEATYGYDFIYGFEQVRGTLQNDRFYGDDKDNLFMGLGGVDYFSGGLGIDTVSYASESGSVQIYLDTNVHGGAAAGDYLSSIERIYGSTFGDLINGNTADNRFHGGGGGDYLRGNAGNDTLIGEDGEDILDGGAGDDLLEGGAMADMLYGNGGIDTASYILSPAAVYLNLAKHVFSGGDAAGDNMQDVENLAGSMLNDRIIGSAGANVLTGNFGDDTIQGCAGNDVIYGDLGPTNAAIASGDCDCCEDTPRYFTLLTYEESIALAVPTDPTASDLIYGDEGNDTIYGEQGNDLLVGGLGNDSILGGAASDILVGGAGNDTLEGGASFDILMGGGDFDYASYASSASAVNINLSKFWGNYGGDASADVLEAIGSATAPSSITELWTEVVLAGALAYLDLQGNTPLATGLPDVLVGIEGIIGSKLGDTLTGDAFANAFIGGQNGDLIAGGGGNDKFIFQALIDAGDTITDFAAGADKIHLQRSGFGVGSGVTPQFLVNAAPTSTAPVLIYSTPTGQLTFDANGTGAGGGTLIATLSNLAGLSASDIIWY